MEYVREWRGAVYNAEGVGTWRNSQFKKKSLNNARFFSRGIRFLSRKHARSLPLHILSHFTPLYFHYLPLNVATLGWGKCHIGSMRATGARLCCTAGLGPSQICDFKPPLPNANFCAQELISPPEKSEPRLKLNFCLILFHIFRLSSSQCGLAELERRCKIGSMRTAILIGAQRSAGKNRPAIFAK